MLGDMFRLLIALGVISIGGAALASLTDGDSRPGRHAPKCRFQFCAGCTPPSWPRAGAPLRVIRPTPERMSK